MEQNIKDYRTTGIFALAGALSMITGAAFLSASGADLWLALSTNTMEAYLISLQQVKTLLIINTCFWILGVLLLGIAVTKMNNSQTSAYSLVRVSLNAAVPMAVVAFISMLSLAITLSDVNSQQSITVATTIGWIGTELDGIATFLIVGLCPFLLSVFHKNEWIPKWLKIWGVFAGVAGFFSLAGMLYSQLSDFIILIIPFGLGWMLAAGIVLIRISKQKNLETISS